VLSGMAREIAVQVPVAQLGQGLKPSFLTSDKGTISGVSRATRELSAPTHGVSGPPFAPLL
jgi:hypothetical protein